MNPMSPLDKVADELRIAEEVAREEGFRPPRLDESLPEYERQLAEYLKPLFREIDSPE